MYKRKKDRSFWKPPGIHGKEGENSRTKAECKRVGGMAQAIGEKKSHTKHNVGGKSVKESSSRRDGGGG